MSELEPVGMKKLARGLFFPVAFRVAVDRVAQHRRSEVFQMDADLVGAPRAGTDEREADRFVERKHPDLAHCFFASFGEDGHLLPVDGMAADRSVKSRIGGATKADGEVSLLHLPAGKGLDEFLMGQRCFGGEEHPRGLFIEAVDDPGSQRIADGRQVLAVGEECVDKGAARVPGSRMDDHSGRLVYGDQVVVFIEDVEGDRFGEKRAFGRELEAYLDLVACFQRNSFFDRMAVQEDKTALDQPLEIGAGKEGVVEGKQLIDPLARFFRPDIERVWGQWAKLGLFAPSLPDGADLSLVFFPFKRIFELS